MNKRCLLVPVLLLFSGCGQMYYARQKDTALKLYLQGLLYETQPGDRAAELFRQSLEKDADNSYLYVKLGEVYLKKKENEAAKESFLQAVKLGTKEADAYFGLGVVCAGEKKYDQAIRYLQDGLALNPAKTAFRMLLCDLLVLRQKYPEAAVQYERLLDEVPSNYLLHYNYGSVLEKTGRDTEAEKEFLRTLELNPNFPRAFLSLGALYDRQKKTGPAIEYYRKAIRSAPSSYLPYLLLQNLYSRENDYDRAKAVLEEAIANKIERSDFYQVLGAIYSDEGNYEKAQGFFSKSLDIEDSGQVRFFLGIVYDKLGQPDKMEEEMKQAVALDPDNALALNYLGYAYLTAGKNIDEALRMIRKAVELEPENGAFLDSLGWAYYLKKNYRQAEKFLLKAASLEPDDEIYAHLGRLYLSMNEYEKALLWGSKSLELKNNPEVLKMLEEAKRKLGGR